MSLKALFGIDLPIVQAPMAGVQGSALAVAVSNAGGLGSLPCAMLGLDVMRQELKAIAAQTTRPFNVNFFCHTVPEPSMERESAWRTALLPYFAELGIDSTAIPAAAARLPFSREAADVLEEFRPAVVSFHFGLPADDMLARARGWGARILSSATTVEEARWLEARGVDAVIAQGVEAGGHRGMFLSDDVNTQVGTLALVPQIAKAVRIPVIAAGGIADSKGVAAAMALGAAGVQVGTAYLLCPEATTSPVHRAALKSDAARVTALTNLFTGRLARGIPNRMLAELSEQTSRLAPFPAQNWLSGQFKPAARRCKKTSSAMPHSRPRNARNDSAEPFSTAAPAVLLPFSWKELIARVSEFARDSTALAESRVARFDDVCVDFTKMEVSRSSGEPITLTTQEFKTLKCFLLNPDRVFSRDELLNEAWGYQNYPSTRTVDNHVLRLRQKLEKCPARPVHFRTVHGVGYKFVR